VALQLFPVLVLLFLHECGLFECAVDMRSMALRSQFVSEECNPKRPRSELYNYSQLPKPAE
jgi:hypothetical protein